MPQITPNLWFDTDGLPAAKFYVSAFPNSEIRNVLHHGEASRRPVGTSELVQGEQIPGALTRRRISN